VQEGRLLPSVYVYSTWSARLVGTIQLRLSAPPLFFLFSKTNNFFGLSEMVGLCCGFFETLG